MPIDALLGQPVPEAALASFLFVLARVGGAISFVPLPGFRNAAVAPKAVLAVAVTLVLYPSWPLARDGAPAPTLNFWWLAGEAAFGIMIGAAAGWLVEIVAMAMQFLGLQAGYSYAAMVDPATQADSGVLPVLGQLTGSLLFFTLGIDREVLRVFAASLETIPPGGGPLHAGLAMEIVRWTGTAITAALRLALPVTGLLVLVDVSLALLGRLQAQLQLLNIAFPAKMLGSMLVIAALAPSAAPVFRKAAGNLAELLHRLTVPLG